MSRSHRELVDNATRGDGPALEALLARHLPGLVAYLRLHCGPMVLARESASDVAQSVCREVLETARGFEYRGEAPFRAWLFQTAANMINERRRKWHTQKRDVRREARPAGESGDRTPLAEILPSFTTPSQVAIREEDMQQLERAFAQLSEEHRQVITLAKLVGLPHRQIAEQMGRSEPATRVLLHRAMLRLAVLLDDFQVGE